MDLELELKRALQREKPPAGFTARVMRRIDERRSTSHPWRAVAAAGLLTVILGGWAVRDAVEQRAAGQKAREEVLTALRITSEKLKTAQSHVREIGSRN